MEKRAAACRMSFLAMLASLMLLALPDTARSQDSEPVFDVDGVRAVSDGRLLYVTATGRASSLGWRAVRLVPLRPGTAGERLDLALVGTAPDGPAAGAMDRVRASYRHAGTEDGPLPASLTVHAAGNVLELPLQGPGLEQDGLRIWCTGSLCGEPLTTTATALRQRIEQHMAERPSGDATRGGCSPSCGHGETCIKWCTGSAPPLQCSWRCVQSGPGGAYPPDTDPGPPTPIDPPPPPQPQPPQPPVDEACMSYCSVTCSGLGGGAFAACMSGCALHCAKP